MLGVDSSLALHRSLALVRVAVLEVAASEDHHARHRELVKAFSLPFECVTNERQVAIDHGANSLGKRLTSPSGFTHAYLPRNTAAASPGSGSKTRIRLPPDPSVVGRSNS